MVVQGGAEEGERDARLEALGGRAGGGSTEAKGERRS